MTGDEPGLRGLLSDWGGVLTTPLNEAIAVWLDADRIDVVGYREVMRAWVRHAYADGSGGEAPADDEGRSAPGNPIHGLEDGSLAAAEFERRLAARLRTTDGRPVPAEGMLRRMFEAFHPVEPMYRAVRQVRAAGVRTGLLSNSWGNDYPRELWAELFDVTVISSEVGMRKPDEGIFRYALDRLGLQPEECVFIDDIDYNVRAAERLGMVGVHHVDVDTTMATLEELFGVPVASPTAS